MFKSGKMYSSFSWTCNTMFTALLLFLGTAPHYTFTANGEKVIETQPFFQQHDVITITT